MHSENTTYGFSLGTPAFECILNRRTLLSGHGAEMKIEPPWAIWNLFCPWTLGEAYWLETALSLVCLKQNIQASGLINRCEMSQLAVKNCFFGFTITIQKWFLPPLPTPPPPHLFRAVFQILIWQDEGENSWRTNRKYLREESQIEENKAYALRKENDPCL